MVFGYVRREEKGRYVVEIEDISESDGAIPSRLGETILRKLEKLVYTYPDQWYIWKNFHRMKAFGQNEIRVEYQKDRYGRLMPSPIQAHDPA